MKEVIKRGAAPALILAAALWAGMSSVQAQQPAAGGAAPAAGRGGGRGPVFTVTSPSFPDGGEIPAHNVSRAGDNKSPQFEFKWMNGTAAATAPETVKTYAIVLHDIENVGPMRGTTDTLHWTAFNIPGTTTTLAEGLGPGVLPDGTTNGPGIASRGGTAPGAYYGPGAGPGPFHHYVFEFYALDTKLDIPASATRDELMKAMEGHVVGKAAYVGRFHGQ
ncbi:MAG TPA: YbhB/YbcL family Raf kinase inhibitor-like protein [Vicinamibacterales bacterium]|jgi:hypothetical protein|nr:YbhB/YbcL family Raf kinase inhibitor-like protein [Vicinamibacterales bacterium]